MTVKKVFEYILSDVWFCPYSYVTVHNSEKNEVVYRICGKERRRYCRIDSDDYHSIVISPRAMEEIKEILQDKRLYKIRTLESPGNIFDGYTQRFYFSDGKKEMKLDGKNIDCCAGDRGKYPNSNIVIDVLGRIANVLIPEGVDERCFQLCHDYQT